MRGGSPGGSVATPEEAHGDARRPLGASRSRSPASRTVANSLYNRARSYTGSRSLRRLRPAASDCSASLNRPFAEASRALAASSIQCCGSRSGGFQQTGHRVKLAEFARRQSAQNSTAGRVGTDRDIEHPLRPGSDLIRTSRGRMDADRQFALFQCSPARERPVLQCAQRATRGGGPTQPKLSPEANQDIVRSSLVLHQLQHGFEASFFEEAARQSRPLVRRPGRRRPGVGVPDALPVRPREPRRPRQSPGVRRRPSPPASAATGIVRQQPPARRPASPGRRTGRRARRRTCDPTGRAPEPECRQPSGFRTPVAVRHARSREGVEVPPAQRFGPARPRFRTEARRVASAEPGAAGRHARAVTDVRRNPEDAARIDPKFLPGLEPPPGRPHMSQKSRALQQVRRPVAIGRDDLVQIGGRPHPREPAEVTGDGYAETRVIAGSPKDPARSPGRTCQPPPDVESRGLPGAIPPGPCSSRCGGRRRCRSGRAPSRAARRGRDCRRSAGRPPTRRRLRRRAATRFATAARRSLSLILRCATLRIRVVPPAKAATAASVGTWSGIAERSQSTAVRLPSAFYPNLVLASHWILAPMRSSSPRKARSPWVAAGERPRRRTEPPQIAAAAAG